MTKRNIVHIEFSSRDLKESTKFYQDLFGWKYEMIPQMNYATWEAGAPPHGGFNPPDMSKPGEVLVYIDSDDIEADLKKAKSLGGTIVREKTEIPNIGWFGVFKDPTGNQVAVYTDMHPEAH